MSGFPSLSVSLCTVILKVLVDVLPEGSLASTVTVNSLFSSFGPQLSTFGVPLIFPFVYVTPVGRSFTAIVASGSSVVTGISVNDFPSTTVWSPILAYFCNCISFHYCLVIYIPYYRGFIILPYCKYFLSILNII